jgi:hypothetical protein
MARTRVWVLVGAAVTVAAGCSGSGDVALTDFPGRLVDIVCQTSNCGRYPDQASCRAAESSTNLPQIQADVAAGKIKYDGAQAGACLELLASISVSCRQSAPHNVDSTPCDETFVGQVPLDGACLVDQDCTSQRCLRPSCGQACCAGTCAAGSGMRVVVGGECGLGVSCVAGAFCNTLAGVCVALQPAGQPCQVPDECENGLICVFDSASGSSGGTCAKPPSEGQACFAPHTCDLAADFCDLTVQKCVRRLAVGSPCALSIDDDGCVRYARCDPGTNTCVARGGVGAPCDLFGLDCQTDLECTGGACMPSPAVPTCAQP